MDKNKKVFLLLGLGVGIVVTNILNYIYPKIQYEELPDEIIISRAKELGMVTLSESLTLTKEQEEKEKKHVKDTEEKENEDQEKELEEENKPKKSKESIEFIVNKGESLSIVAERLKEQGIIEDENSFKDYVVSKEMQSKINYGRFNLNKDDSYEDILKKLVEK